MMEVGIYKIKYSEVYEKFQVWTPDERCIEEFENIKDAIEFAKEN